MRKFLIDTDTASDDAVAMCMALRHPDIEVVGFTGSRDYLAEQRAKVRSRVNDFIGGQTDAFVTKLSPDGSQVVFNRFLGGSAPSCFAAADANADGGVDLGDAIYTLSNQFLGGPGPVAPFPECGVSENPNELQCESSRCLQ